MLNGREMSEEWIYQPLWTVWIRIDKRKSLGIPFTVEIRNPWPRIPIPEETFKFQGVRYLVDQVDWDFDDGKITIHLGPL
jgi:hypothetical protein